MNRSIAIPTRRASGRVQGRLATPRVLTIGLVALLAVAVIASVGIGAVGISPAQVVAILLRQLGLDLGGQLRVWINRGCCWGFGCRVCCWGCLLAARLVARVAANARAVPQSPCRPRLDWGQQWGRAGGGALSFVLGHAIFPTLLDQFGMYAIPIAAFVGGLLATVVVYQISARGGVRSVGSMLLAGIAVNALAGAAIGLCTYVATDAQLRNLTFWSLGSLAGGTWQTLAAVAPPVLLALLLLPRFARQLNMLALGEGEAAHLGVSINLLKWRVTGLCALAVGAAVSMAGLIGFIPLIAPHLVRLTIGPDHRHLIPCSTLLGAGLLVAADLCSRTVVAPAELPIGIITAIVGAPFFLWLLMREQRLIQ
ncbi:MAG: transport system permease protein [Chlorobi bacterium OLB7]|nr:MAG: transport system permease protein [Chlorobi bacterium OLB7]